MLAVRAKPTGKQNRIISTSGSSVEVELAARPKDGEANLQLIEYFSDILHIRKKEIQLISGDKGRDKTLLVNPGAVTCDNVKQFFDIEASG